MMEQAAAPPSVDVWSVEICPAPGQRDRRAEELAAEAAETGLIADLQVHCRHGFLLQGKLSGRELEKLARDLLVEPVVEQFAIGSATGSAALA